MHMMNSKERFIAAMNPDAMETRADEGGKCIYPDEFILSRI